MRTHQGRRRLTDASIGHVAACAYATLYLSPSIGGGRFQILTRYNFKKPKVLRTI